jgi:hypothetical protein
MTACKECKQELPPDENPPYQGMDGLRRDIAKLKYTGGIWWDYMWPEIKRVLKWPSPHNVTNFWVEGCRAEAYFFGHVLTMIFYRLPILAGIILFGLGLFGWLDQ